MNSPPTGGRAAGARDGVAAPALACGALILMIGLQLMLPGEGPTGDIALRAPRRLRPVAPPTLQEYPAILASPIFAPDRRPGAAMAPNEDPGATGNLNRYAALGAVAGPRLATAVIKAPDGTVRTLHRGDELEGWRLAVVGRNQLTFERAGERKDLKIGAAALWSTPPAKFQ